MIVPNYYENLQVLHENTMPYRAYYIPASKPMGTLVHDREKSDRFQLLNGDWKFKYYKSIYDLQEEFYREETLTETYDFIFMDAAKGQYIHFMPDILRLLGSEGTLVSDNVLQDGDLIQSRFAVERRNRTIYKRMREYLYVLKNHEELETSIIPLGDGVTLSIKK